MTRQEYHERLRKRFRQQNGRRDEAIRARRRAGWTLERIGLKYGMTKERVRQILKSSGAK